MSNSQKGRVHSERTKRKIGNSNKGKLIGRFIGHKSPVWKGGRSIDGDGYILIKKYNHPFAKDNGYVPEHRVIMEKHLGRYLRPEEVIHHINGIKDDNRIENLKLFANNGEHKKFHSSVLPAANT